MQKWKAYLLILGPPIGFLFALLLWMAFGPAAPLIISKATTNITQPLTADGRVDYRTAIFQQLGPRIPPEQNQAVPFLQATWPARLEPRFQQLVCDELQIEMPPESTWGSWNDDGELQADFERWLHPGTSGNPTDSLDAALQSAFSSFSLDAAAQAAINAPWRREQLPPLAAWLDRQQQPLDQLHQIADRPGYYLPPTRFFDPENIAWNESYFPAVAVMSHAASSLSMRAMLSLGQQQPAQAWRDIQTIFRLSDMRPKRPDYAEWNVAISTREMAIAATWRLLASGQCDSAMLAEIAALLAAQEPIQEEAESADHISRWKVLEYAQLICAGDQSIAENLHDPSAPPLLAEIAATPFDRNAMMTTLNDWHDRAVAAARLQDPIARYQALRTGGVETRLARQRCYNSSQALFAVVNQRQRGELLGHLLADWVQPFDTFTLVQEDQCNIGLQLLRVGVLLEIYRLEHQEFPASLEMIDSSDNHDLLSDPCSSGLLRYRRQAEGYLLYSVYLDGIDDGGDHMDDTIVDGLRVASPPTWPNYLPDGHDLVVLLPLQQFDLPQPEKK